MSDLQVVLTSENRSEICERILRALPEWFGIESAIVEYAKEARHLTFLHAIIGGREAGFLTLTFPTPISAEIHAMAVLKAFHRQGVGSALTRAAELEARKLGARSISVKTLGADHPSPEYRGTREFYLAQGFLPVRELPDEWPSGNPCQLMRKLL